MAWRRKKCAKKASKKSNEKPSRRESACWARQAQKARERNLRIASKPVLRTLKRSERKKLDRARAPNQWILPRIHDQGFAWKSKLYPEASLLGLPREVRQQILYEVCSITSLQEAVSMATKMKENHVETPYYTTDGMAGFFKGTRGQRTGMAYLDNPDWSFVSVLGRAIGTLCAVSPALRADMQHVSKLLYHDLEKFLDKLLLPSRLPSTQELPRMDKAAALSKREKKRKKGWKIKGKAWRDPGKRPRPHKCWYCTERHYAGDPVCPPSRREPEKWNEVTKKVGGAKAKMNSKSSYQGKKTVFSESWD